MKHFSIPELCASSVATKYKIENKPGINEKKHLVELVDYLLEPLREAWGKYCKDNNLGTAAIQVTSGYRCPTLNRLVGGVTTSAHMSGYAADIKPMNRCQTIFEKWISTEFAKSGVKFDQIIIERSKSARWIHVAVRSKMGAQRQQCFKLNV